MDAVHNEGDRWFRKMCIDVARKLSENDVYTLLYLYSVHVPAEYTTPLSKVLYVFTHLEKEGHLSSDKTGIDFLLEMLDDLPRRDIKKDCEPFIQRNRPNPGT